MSYLLAIFLGFVQGITEFLPISSSGHLSLLENIFHIEQSDMMFDALLHVGTLISICIAYSRETRGLLSGGLGLIGVGKGKFLRSTSARENRRMAIFVIVGSIPLVLSFLIKPKVEQLTDSVLFVGLMLMVTGLILFLADRFSYARKTERQITLLDILLVGLGQAVAVIPGISRSAATISTGMLRGFQKTFAVKFAFLLSIPAVLGAALVSFFQAFRTGFDPGMLPAYLLGMIVSVISGSVCIRFIRWAAARSRFGGFAYYCWGAGIVALLLSLVA